jgi:2-(1,2-epoxy-1,2-dihydrophenyl)acetyl-CoA isomerase
LTLRIDDSGAVRTLTLDRPDRLNAFDAALHAALRDALSAAAAEEAVKVVVLTGSGRAFSSGQDLTENLPRDEAGRIDLKGPLERDYNPLVLALHRFPKPTIAALNGPAVGASTNIALACDIVLAARSASLQQAFVRIGLIPDAGGTWLLPRIIGAKRALALMMTGEPVAAQDALALGLVHRVYEDADFAASVGEFALTLAQGPMLALRLIKEAVRQSLDNDLEAQLMLEERLQCEAGRSADFEEGVSAFRAKRAPAFTGR